MNFSKELRGKEEAAKNSKKLSHSAHASGMKELY
jgi:hypothetical protein